MTTLKISPAIRRLNSAVEEFDYVTGGRYDRLDLDEIIDQAETDWRVSTRLFEKLVELQHAARPALLMDSPEADREDSP